jgi:aminomethyltransferase
MPVGTPFHERTFPLCESLNYREWSGYYAVSSFESHHEHEYHAIRNAAALIDISPLFKYRLAGPDAVRLVDRVITRDATRIRVGQAIYTPWCDEAGHVIDDGTVARLEESTFRWTAAEPNLRWLVQNAEGLRVAIEEESESLAALALQGPTSARLLRAAAELDLDLDRLPYFGVTRARIGGVDVHVSRTGYTGDLGYELWVPRDEALRVWDALMAVAPLGRLVPAGLLALDVARVEAGLLLLDVDFVSSRKATIASQRYTPYEMGLERLVHLDKGPFIGRGALRAAQQAGLRRRIVGLAIDWAGVERLHEKAGLVPVAPAAASRVAVPVMKNGRQIGRATTTAWSPMLKRLLALATVDAPYFERGTAVDVEFTVDASRHAVRAIVVPTPFFNPARKTAVPPPV